MVLLVELLHNKLSIGAKYVLYMFFSFPLLGALAAFRYNVGVDYNEYDYVFNLVRFNNHDAEPFINIIIYFFSFFTNSNLPIFALLAFLTVYLFIDFIIKNSQSVFISFCIFLCFGGFYLGVFNHSRQFLAVSIFLFSFKYINSSSFKYYAVCIVLAATVHYSAILLLPFYFVCKLRFSIRNVLLLSLFYFFSLSLAELFIKLTPYGVYLDRVVENQRNTFLTIGFIFIAYLYVFLGLLKCENHGGSRNVNSIFLYMSLFSGLLLTSTFVSSIPWNLFFRLNGYFIPFLIIFFGYLYIKLKDLSLILSISYKFLFFLVCCLYLFFSLAYKGSEYNLVPYNSIF